MNYKINPPKNINGLSTPEEFESIVENGFLSMPNMLCLGGDDINRFCRRRGVFDSLRIESSKRAIGEDLENGIRTIIAAHGCEKLQCVIFQFTATHDEIFDDMMKSVNKGFSKVVSKLDDEVEIMWGVAMNPKDMKAECGIYIIANFK